ncbi:MAG: hypothetical protein WC477_03430 [Patescibacteria group bacterium]
MAIRRQTHRARNPYPVPQTSGAYAKIAYSFVALTVVVVLAALWFSSVRATITISVSRTETPIALETDISKNASAGAISGRIIQSVFSDMDEYTVTSTQQTVIPGTSEGKVKISNRYSADQTLIKTTRLLTADGRLYRISETVVVPSGGSVTANAYADQIGPSYDFASSTIFTIPGLSASLQKFITAENIGDFTGGAKVTSVLSQSDITNAANVLRAKILSNNKASLHSSINDPRLNESVYLIENVEQAASAQPGDQTNHFLLSMKVKVTGVFYAKQDMDDFISKNITQHLPTGVILADDSPTKVDYQVNSADGTNETAHITATVNVLTKPTTASNLVNKQSIAGLPIDEAVQVLEQVKGIESADISVSPGWVRRLPTVQDRMSVRIR